MLLPRRVLRELIDLCHGHEVRVSTGGFLEYVLPQGDEAVRRTLGECQELGFDIVEVLPTYDGPGQITSLVAANVAFEMLSLVALRRKERQMVQLR